jgi:hypothetical protein
MNIIVNFVKMKENRMKKKVKIVVKQIFYIMKKILLIIFVKSLKMEKILDKMILV